MMLLTTLSRRLFRLQHGCPMCTTAAPKSSQNAPSTVCPFCGLTFPSTSLLHLHLHRRHAAAVTDHLRADPYHTYTAIYGDAYKSAGARELRWPGGLVVQLEGAHAGHWFSFTRGKGGGPISAVMDEHGMTFGEAMEFAARLTGLGREELKGGCSWE